MKKDIITKTIIRDLAIDISRYILKLDISDNIELIEKEFDRVEKREADILFKDGKKIVHIEIQNSNQTIFPLRMLRYFTDICFEFFDYEIRQYVIYIGKDRCLLKDGIERENISYKYHLIDMREIDCEKLLFSDDISAVALSILCDFKDRDKQMVVNTILKKLKELSGGDSYIFRKYLKMVEVLSENRDLTKEIKKGEEMLTVDIEKMPSYEIGFERGVEKGIEKGIEKGKMEEKRNIAKMLLKLHDEETVAKIVGLSIEEVKKIKIDFIGKNIEIDK